MAAERRQLNPAFDLDTAELFATTLLALDAHLQAEGAHDYQSEALMASLVDGLRAMGVDPASVHERFRQRIEMGGKPS